jgi:CheY-like chemotaxis protein
MKKILLIDNDEKIRSIYRQALENEGYFVLDANGWDRGTTLLSSHPNTDLVLLDIDMPSITGDALYNAIRLYNPKIRIVMFSVFSTDEQRRMVHKADDYFDKSDGVEILLNKVRQILASSLASES